ncbi:hypothetical protein M413DRAFT_305404 [Hebeloma cylindrosporum]|uniref:Uncharacterized protein n=1 Tax=Hebeloma cylindrosporum TaxID=76867 RepID=A0A0C2Y8K6_HEBCY|nr:hypothetical protein M413DRAFT_305404 [Hebeloma cylindrosporum h7]
MQRQPKTTMDSNLTVSTTTCPAVRHEPDRLKWIDDSRKVEIVRLGSLGSINNPERRC